MLFTVNVRAINEPNTFRWFYEFIQSNDCFKDRRMTPQHVISQLLTADKSKNYQHVDLLRKIILTSYLGRLQINGQAPDNKVSLGNYLFDDERMMFDFTRLSDNQRARFNEWLYGPNHTENTNNIILNEYRGFTAEVGLSWWGWIRSWLEGRYSEHWKIKETNLSLTTN